QGDAFGGAATALSHSASIVYQRTILSARPVNKARDTPPGVTPPCKECYRLRAPRNCDTTRTRLCVAQPGPGRLLQSGLLGFGLDLIEQLLTDRIDHLLDRRGGLLAHALHLGGIHFVDLHALVLQL